MAAAVSPTPHPKVSSQGGALQSPIRPSLLHSEANNGLVGDPRRPKSREVTSRYLSSSTCSSYTTTSTSADSSSSRSSSSYSCSSRPCPLPSSMALKRSQSVERRRPGIPRPSTPGNATEMSAVAKLLVTSTRNLSVSSAPASPRKATPDRRKGTLVKDHAENSKSIDRHRWPGRYREAKSFTRSVDCSAEKKKLGGSGSVVGALQNSMIHESSTSSFNGRLEEHSTNAKLHKAIQLFVDTNSAPRSSAGSVTVSSDNEIVSSGSTGGVQGRRGCFAQLRGGKSSIMVSPRFWQETASRSRHLPEPGSPASKNNGFTSVPLSKRNSILKPSIYGPISSPRGPFSPSRGIPSPCQARSGVSSGLNNNLSNNPSILSFAAEVRRRKVGEKRIVNAHLLRLLYNRHLQWRFINARVGAAMWVQKITAEKSLYNAWVTTTKLRHSVKSKRVELQLQRQSLKLYFIIKGQMLYLDDWDLIDRDDSRSLSGAIEALEARSLQVPVGGGARADTQSVKDAICSAVNVMQAMASSICTSLTKVDEVNSLLSELANVTSKECALLDQCKDLLSSLTAIQVKVCSMRTHILQLRREPSHA